MARAADPPLITRKHRSLSPAAGDFRLQIEELAAHSGPQPDAG